MLCADDLIAIFPGPVSVEDSQGGVLGPKGGSGPRKKRFIPLGCRRLLYATREKVPLSRETPFLSECWTLLESIMASRKFVFNRSRPVVVRVPIRENGGSLYGSRIVIIRRNHTANCSSFRSYRKRLLKYYSENE